MTINILFARFFSDQYLYVDDRRVKYQLSENFKMFFSFHQFSINNTFNLMEFLYGVECFHYKLFP